MPGHHLGHIWASSGAYLGHHLKACLGQSKISAVLHASLMPFGSSGGVIVVVVAMVVVVLYSGGGSTLASRSPPVSMLALWALWVQNYFTALFSWVIFQDHIHIVSCSEKCQTITTQVPLVLLLASSTTLANLLPGQSTHHGHGVGGVEQGNHHAADHQAENAQHHLPKGPRRTVLNRNGRKVRVVFCILIQVNRISYFDQSQLLSNFISRPSIIQRFELAKNIFV